MKKLAIIALLAACALPAKAVVIFGNLQSYNNDGGTFTTISSGSGKAMGFTMAADTYDITSVSLRLGGVGDNASDVPKVSIWTNVGNVPNAQVGDAFVNPTFSTPGAYTTYTFTPAAPLTLLPNTSYFLVVQNGTSSATFNWINGSPTVAPTGIAGTGIARYGNNSNATTYNQSSGNFNWFRIDGTVAAAVPEPSAAAALLGVSALGWVVARRRRNR